MKTSWLKQLLKHPYWTAIGVMVAIAGLILLQCSSNGKHPTSNDTRNAIVSISTEYENLASFPTSEEIGLMDTDSRDISVQNNIALKAARLAHSQGLEGARGG